MKTCATCKWMKDPGKYATCWAPQNMQATNSRTGFEPDEEDLRFRFCSVQRSGSWLGHYLFPIRDCGKPGSWWRPRDQDVAIGSTMVERNSVEVGA